MIMKEKDGRTKASFYRAEATRRLFERPPMPEIVSGGENQNQV